MTMNACMYVINLTYLLKFDSLICVQVWREISHCKFWMAHEVGNLTTLTNKNKGLLIGFVV